MADTIQNLHVERVGAGPPLLLIHGFASSTFTWRHVVNAFRDRFEVWAVDLLGHGDSPKPANAAYTIEHQSQLIRALIKRIGSDQLTIMGHSYGGGVTLRTLIGDAVPRVQRVVLIGAAAYGQKLPPFIRFLRRPILGRWIPPLVPTSVMAKRALYFAYHQSSRITQEQIQGWARPLGKSGARESLRQTAVHVLPENLDELTAAYPRIEVPTLLVWGKHDRIVPIETGRRLHQALPHAELVVVEDCGHIPHEERPEFTLGILEDFLRT